MHFFRSDLTCLTLASISHKVLGSVLYLIRIEWLVFTARFVAGVGSAVGECP